MFDEQFDAKRTLQRIADALKIDVSAFTVEHGEAEALRERLELLSLFETIVSPSNRRACLAFVRSIVALQRDPAQSFGDDRT
jgi:hypothetical protein